MLTVVWHLLSGRRASCRSSRPRRPRRAPQRADLGAAQHASEQPLPTSVAAPVGHHPGSRRPEQPDCTGHRHCGLAVCVRFRVRVGSRSSDSSSSDDDSPAVASRAPAQTPMWAPQAAHVTAATQQVPPPQRQQQAAQKPKAPVIKLKLSGALLPARPPVGAQPQRQDPAAVKIELAPAPKPPQGQYSSSDASISDSDSEQAAPAPRPTVGPRKPASRCVTRSASVHS